MSACVFACRLTSASAVKLQLRPVWQKSVSTMIPHYLHINITLWISHRPSQVIILFWGHLLSNFESTWAAFSVSLWELWFHFLPDQCFITHPLMWGMCSSITIKQWRFHTSAVGGSSLTGGLYGRAVEPVVIDSPLGKYAAALVLGS